MSMYRRRLMIANALKKSSGINYPGLIAAWSAKGKTNDDEDRAILKDLTGNGHDITLNGFTFSEMSGYGGYSMDITNLRHDPFQGGTTGTVIQNNVGNTIYLTYTSSRENGTPYDWFAFWNRKTEKVEGTSVDIQMTDDSLALYYRYYDGTSAKYIKLTNGVNHLPGSVINPNDPGNIDGIYSTNSIEGVTVVIKEIPKYPDALVFDGVDDYGINENMPILTDYTVIVNRRYIETEKNSCLISKAAGVGKGAFIMELIEGDSNTTYNYSFDNLNKIKLYTSTGISWLNTTSYNGFRVDKGGGIDTNSIFVGAIRKSDSRRFKGAFYSAYLFDRSLDEQEIKSFIRKYIDPEYLLPSE